MDKFLESRWFLRGFALLMAGIMFMTVNSPDEDSNNTNTNSQSDFATIENVPVDTIYNEEALVVTGVPSTVDVMIQGPTQVVTRTNTLKDFRVFLNVGDMDIGTHEVRLQHEGFSNQLTVTLSDPEVNVKIDERVTEEFTVDAEFNNGIIPEGFELDQISVNPETVSITGAKGIIDTISYVRASINLDEPIDGEATVESSVQVLDSNLDKLPVTVEPANAEVTISVVQPNKEVTLVPEQTGTLADGLEVEDLELSNDTVTIFGRASVIEEIDEITVPFDLTGVEESGSRIEVPIPVPDGVDELSESSVSAIVTFNNDEDEEASETDEVAGEGEASAPPDEPESEPSEEPNEEETASEEPNTDTEEELTLSALPVEIRNASDDLQANFQDPSSGELNLRVTGESDEIEEIDEEDISLYVDATDLAEGEHELEVQIEGPSNVTYILSQANVTIQLAQA